MNNPKKNFHKSRSQQLGFTMVELLVAMGLSAGLLFGVLQIFDANRQGSHMQTAFSEVQEGGRIAIEILARDIRMASSWGCNKTAANVKKHIPVVTSNQGWGIRGLAASNNVGSGASVGGTSVKPASDMVTVMGAFGIGNAQVRQPYMLSKVDNITINTGATIPLGTELVISSCEGTDIFANTKVDTNTSGVISHGKTLDYMYGADARLGIPFTHQYFIGQNSEGGWSLFRKVNEASPEELVRNVTDLQIVYGIGNVTAASSAAVTSTPFASQFVEQPTSSQLSEIISVRMQLTLDSQGLMSDGAPLQKTFLATANIRNNSLKTVSSSKPNF